jgi:hypothetical protein
LRHLTLRSNLPQTFSEFLLQRSHLDDISKRQSPVVSLRPPPNGITGRLSDRSIPTLVTHGLKDQALSSVLYVKEQIALGPTPMIDKIKLAFYLSLLLACLLGMGFGILQMKWLDGVVFGGIACVLWLKERNDNLAKRTQVLEEAVKKQQTKIAEQNERLEHLVDGEIERLRDDTKRKIAAVSHDVQDISEQIEELKRSVGSEEPIADSYEKWQARLPLDVATEADLERAVEAAIEETNASSLKQMGLVIKAARGLLGKTFDEKDLSKLVRCRLEGKT